MDSHDASRDFCSTSLSTRLVVPDTDTPIPQANSDIILEPSEKRTNNILRSGILSFRLNHSFETVLGPDVIISLKRLIT